MSAGGDGIEDDDSDGMVSGNGDMSAAGDGIEDDDSDDMVSGNGGTSAAGDGIAADVPPFPDTISSLSSSSIPSPSASLTTATPFS